MGELLPFPTERWHNAVPPNAGARPLSADLVAKVLELGPGGSLAGATEPEIQAAALEANPMRRVASWECNWCNRRWTAPAASACPGCHSEAIELLEEHINMAQRLK